MATYLFLSDEWLDRGPGHPGRVRRQGRAPFARIVRMNLVITEVPFGEGTVARPHGHQHAASSSWTSDHIDPVDLKVTLDYDMAKAILIEGNPQAGMQAFMSGKIKVGGRHRQADGPADERSDPDRGEVAARIQAMTE